MNDFSQLFRELTKNFKDLSRRVAKFETWEPFIAITTFSNADVSNPPSDTELNAVFGTPSTVGTNFVGLLDDDGANSNVYLCMSNGVSWWYVALTKAV